MRLLLAAAAVAFAVPVAAAPRADHSDYYSDEAVANLPSPAAIDDAGRAVDRAMGAIMNVPIGEVVEAVDPGRDPRRRDETLGDMASRDDPYFEQRMHGSVAAATAGMGVMIERLAVLAPALRATMRDVERRVDDATRDLPGLERD
ncbi:MAG: hypothetical protein JWN69_528 [Alphaproteobacteria bacterium]|nr:hypothetical protein [Alphaproteobacteria bacterium]